MDVPRRRGERESRGERGRRKKKVGLTCGKKGPTNFYRWHLTWHPSMKNQVGNQSWRSFGWYWKLEDVKCPVLELMVCFRQTEEFEGVKWTYPLNYRGCNVSSWRHLKFRTNFSTTTPTGFKKGIHSEWYCSWSDCSTRDWRKYKIQPE